MLRSRRPTPLAAPLASELLRFGAARLRAAGIEQPRREARLLLGHALGIDQAALLALAGAAVSADKAYLSLLDRRAAREPLAFILGEREFWSLRFEVSPATLIPRPESETLIEAALSLFPDRNAVRRVLDLGAGTGCLLLAALSEFQQAFGIGIDRVPEAAALARLNAARLGLGSRSAFVVGDWAAALDARFDLVLCNPPYIRRADIPGLMAEVARHEPASALDGGEDGLAAYRRLVPVLPRLLGPGGAAILELGLGQDEAVADLARRAGMTMSFKADLAGVPRALICLAGAQKPFGTAS